jgi:hypothetical protein
LTGGLGTVRSHGDDSGSPEIDLAGENEPRALGGGEISGQAASGEASMPASTAWVSASWVRISRRVRALPGPLLPHDRAEPGRAVRTAARLPEPVPCARHAECRVPDARPATALRHRPTGSPCQPAERADPSLRDARSRRCRNLPADRQRVAGLRILLRARLHPPNEAPHLHEACANTAGRTEAQVAGGENARTDRYPYSGSARGWLTTDSGSAMASPAATRPALRQRL